MSGAWELRFRGCAEEAGWRAGHAGGLQGSGVEFDRRVTTRGGRLETGPYERGRHPGVVGARGRGRLETGPDERLGTPRGIGREKAVGVRGITSGRGRLETGPYERGRQPRVVGGRGRGRLETGPYERGRQPRVVGGRGRGRLETGPYEGWGPSNMRVRRPRRLGAYDYSQDGAYSVTICTDWREHLFGTVTDGRMELNAAGRAVEKVWQGCRSIIRTWSWMCLW